MKAGLFRRKLVLLGAMVLGAARCGAEAQDGLMDAVPPPVLTNVIQALELTADQLRPPRNVKLRGVMTFVDPYSKYGFLQDETAGVGVFWTDWTNRTPPVSAGQLVEIDGRASANSYSPTIDHPVFRDIQPGEFPKPLQVPFADLWAGRADSQWVEVEGQVRSATIMTNHFLDLEMVVDQGQKLLVSIFTPERPDISNLVNSRVRIRGVAGGSFNNKNQFITAQLLVPSMDQVTTLEQARSNPYSLPVSSLASLGHRAETRPGDQIHLQDVVTLLVPGEALYLQNGTNCVEVRTSERGGAKPGDRVDVIGFYEKTDHAPIVENGRFRVLASGPSPVPVTVTMDEIENGLIDAELVTIQGRVLEWRHGPLERAILLQGTNEVVFRARLSRDDSAGGNAVEYPVGSLLQVTGVCVITAVNQDLDVTSFELRLRSADDLVLLRRAAWWTTARILWALGVLTAGGAIMLGWVWLLKRANFRLERGVTERTADLATANQSLVAEIGVRKRAEDSLRLFEYAVAQAGESIVITDAQLDLPGPRIVFVNPAFTKITGYTAAEVLGKTPRLLQGPRTDKSLRARMRETLARGETFHAEAVNYRKDGSEFDLEWQVAPIRDPAGVVTHYVSMQRDITERLRFEARLFQSQKMETVGKLAGGVAHEFNSIMTAVIGQCELMLDDMPSGNPLRKNATEIHQAAERAATLTRQLLAYGRKQILQPDVLDLNAVLTGMENTLRHLGGRDVDVRITPASGPKLVKVDPGQIEQVIVNIVMNAADAMPHGGKLTLETGEAVLDEEYASQFSDLKAGDYIMLAITDTGAGMTEAAKARIFEPFFTTKDVGKGTGLGLATCHGIIKQSEGHIDVYSEPGRGATFKVYLPKVALETKTATLPVKAPGLPRGTETILMVEDDPALREMAATLLRRLGYTVLTAGNGLEALSVTHLRATGHIDMLFTDVVMPHMSGKELSDRIKALYPDTKILFTSAYTENAIVHQGVLNAGVTLLQKPFTPTALANKVREVLGRNTAAAAAI